VGRYTGIMPSKATTVQAYLKSLPADRRDAIERLRAVVLENLDEGVEEGMSYGMIGYYIPHSIYPVGYHCDPKQPLPFAGIASQKQHMSLYLMCLYQDAGQDAWFRGAWAKSGHKLDMGKACIRFKDINKIPLDVIGEAISRMTIKDYITSYEAQLGKSGVARGAVTKAGAGGAGAAKGASRRTAASGLVAEKAPAARGAAAKKGLGATQPTAAAMKTARAGAAKAGIKKKVSSAVAKAR